MHGSAAERLLGTERQPGHLQIRSAAGRDPDYCRNSAFYFAVWSA